MDILRLLDLTEQILILRGGPTSGNWSHVGRKGKRGGSGRGGGFKKIGVKSGKAGRGKIKQASRQTRAKEERKKQGNEPGNATKKSPKASKKTIDNPADNLSNVAKFAMTKAGESTYFSPFGVVPSIPSDVSAGFKELERKGLGKISKNKNGDDMFTMNTDGEKTLTNLMRQDKNVASLTLGSNKKASEFFLDEIPNAKDNKERIDFAKNSLSLTNAKDQRVAEKNTDVPAAPKGGLSKAKIDQHGINSVFIRSDGTYDVGKIVREGDKFMSSKTEQVEPLFAN